MDSDEEVEQEADFTFNAGKRPQPPERGAGGTSFKRKYTNFVSRVQRMTKKKKKEVLELPKAASASTGSKLPHFRLNPDIKTIVEGVDSAEGTPRSVKGSRISIFISSGFSAPKAYLTPRSKSSTRADCVTPLARKESSSTSLQAGDRTPIPVPILVTMMELRKDRFASFQILFPFNEVSGQCDLADVSRTHGATLTTTNRKDRAPQPARATAQQSARGIEKAHVRLLREVTHREPP